MINCALLFTKSGICLWHSNFLQGLSDSMRDHVNHMIKNLILEERNASTGSHKQGDFMIEFILDNELELIFAAVYDRILSLVHVDTMLNEFRNAIKNQLALVNLSYKIANENDIENVYQRTISLFEKTIKMHQPEKHMKSYDESAKSKRSLPLNTAGVDKSSNKSSKRNTEKRIGNRIDAVLTDEQLIAKNRLKLREKFVTKKMDSETMKNSDSEKTTKKPRIWELGGNTKDLQYLDRSKKENTLGQDCKVSHDIVGTMKGNLKDLHSEKLEETTNGSHKGILSYFHSFIGSKSISKKDLAGAIEKMKEHLISKNVAADVASKLCESVAKNLEGKCLGTLETISFAVKSAMTDALTRILTPKRRIDILRDALESKKQGNPYVIVFCGVNGVGKSTNLSKICFWLIENNLRVVIAACDTFRAGAVEQLRTHTKQLNALHPVENNAEPMVHLYEKGYGKDAAGIAMEAIKYASESDINIVLIDTAGRMQDNEPLMRSLSKLITYNNPDLVLFVGEALVGNEAVDQLVKFNQALADFSAKDNPHTIDGIILTKFDAIDDKVGAAISMTYVTGQPIVFVGTGQTYSDIKSLNSNSIVLSLMK